MVRLTARRRSARVRGPVSVSLASARSLDERLATSIYRQLAARAVARGRIARSRSRTRGPLFYFAWGYFLRALGVQLFSAFLLLACGTHLGERLAFAGPLALIAGPAVMTIPLYGRRRPGSCEFTRADYFLAWRLFECSRLGGRLRFGLLVVLLLARGGVSRRPARLGVPLRAGWALRPVAPISWMPCDPLARVDPVV